MKIQSSLVSSCAVEKDGVDHTADIMQYLRLKLTRNILKLGILLLLLVFTIMNWNKMEALFEENLNRHDSLLTMESIVPGNRNLFFLETSCALNSEFPPYYISGLRINTRQACAMYSTAILNPTRQIILYHSCPLHKDFYERSTVYNKYLLDLPNFYIFQGNLQDLIEGSIIEHLYDDVKSSIFPIEHAADILSLLMVYKYGGACLDLDFISIKSINALPKNFIGAESETLLSNGVFQFERQGKGHEFVREMLEDLAFNYNNLEWAANGPELFTRNFRKFCNVSEDMPITSQIFYPCGISVGNFSLFFPVIRSSWKTLFIPPKKALITYLLKNAVAIRFWNTLSKNEIVEIGGHSVYELFARRHCKKILLSSGPTF